jgi:Fic family protein
MTAERHSTAREAELVTDPVEKATVESRNAVNQFDLVMTMVEHWTSSTGPKPFRLRPSMILDLHRAALESLSLYAGNWRPGSVAIAESKHTPPASFLVPGLIEELCDHVNENFRKSAIHLAAYVMWKVNWIHPFVDGNGRTSRALSYLVLCVRLGYRIPGTKTIPDLISVDKMPYYDALEAADKGDLTQMEKLLGELLANQLLTVIDAAGLDEKEAES